MNILFVEGLGLFYKGSQLKKQLMPYYQHHNCTRIGWAKFNLKDWKADIIVGLSFGGAAACEIAKHNPSCKAVITMDARVLYRPYKKAEHVIRHVNFFQTGFMRGYEIEGADNIKVRGYRHTAMPSNPDVKNIIDNYIKQIRQGTLK